jgi:uncharacterized protein YodC (DUF2158 family)
MLAIPSLEKTRMANQFKAGDVVVLNSGGPKMTVSEVGTHPINNKPRVWCEWFDGSKKIDDDFAPESLQLANF